MDIGVTIGQVDGATGRPVPVAELAEQAEEAERLGFDSVWLMDHFWSEREGRRFGGHEPMVSLAYIAARTRRVRLGVLVLCHAFRHAGQLAREAAALAEASEGRFILGLGAGWYDPEFEAFGLPVDRKVSRLEEAVPVLQALLRGERLTVDGASLQLRDASVITSGKPPPLWLGALRPRMIALTARYADGWNTVWGGADPEWLRERIETLHKGLQEAGRDPAEVTVSAGIHCLPDREPDIPATWRAYEAAGVDHLVVNLASTPFRLQDRAYLGQAGEALRSYRSG